MTAPEPQQVIYREPTPVERYTFDESIQTSPPPVVKSVEKLPIRSQTLDMSVETDHEEPVAIVEIAKVEEQVQTADDWDKRMKEWMEEQIIARMPPKMPSRDQCKSAPFRCLRHSPAASSVSDLLALSRNNDLVAAQISDSILAEVINKDLRLILLQLLDRRRTLDSEAYPLRDRIVEEVVHEESEKIARDLLKQRYAAQLDSIALAIQRELMNEVIVEECQWAARWALRNRTPEPAPVIQEKEPELLLPHLPSLTPPRLPTPEPVEIEVGLRLLYCKFIHVLASTTLTAKGRNRCSNRTYRRGEVHEHF